MKKTIIVIPTYNENNNILKLYNSLIGLKINFDILFVDDNSTDGTKEKILLLNKKSNVYFIFRKKKLGIGSAHKDALVWCYKKKYKFIITMDEFIPLYYDESEANFYKDNLEFLTIGTIVSSLLAVMALYFYNKYNNVFNNLIICSITAVCIQ